MTIREPICGATVCLGPLRVANAAEWVRWMEDPETTRYLYAPGERPKERFTLAVALDWGRRVLADPQRLVFAITERATGKQVGDARLVPSGRRRARFSIVIGEGSARGRGLGGEATRMVCRYAFDQLALEQIDLEVDPRNTPAVRAYFRVGFERTGRRTMKLTRRRWDEGLAGTSSAAAA
jgi:diamine N-acetyltransferase